MSAAGGERPERARTNVSDPIAIAPAVAAALAARRPVVALETTLVTHGLPRPEGLDTALELEAEVAAGGALPATIGVLDGRVRVGLTRDELERLAAAEQPAKLNLSNLAARVASGGPGSTTVSATMQIAARCGIEAFATGGIGGVHRGAAETGDVSSDLTALARYPVAVVCAGAKAVLDLPRTVEMLETLGIPVFGFQTERFPAFYRRDAGLPVDEAFGTIEALARAARAHWALGGRHRHRGGEPDPARARDAGGCLPARARTRAGRSRRARRARTGGHALPARATARPHRGPQRVLEPGIAASQRAPRSAARARPAGRYTLSAMSATPKPPNSSRTTVCSSC